MSNIPNEGYALTISGLLRKRAEILADLTAIREKAASLTNDLHSMDRVLMSLGYTGDLDAQKPSQRTRMFVRGELRKFVLDTLREAGEPLSSRELAIRRAQFEGKDPTDDGHHVPRQPDSQRAQQPGRGAEGAHRDGRVRLRVGWLVTYVGLGHPSTAVARNDHFMLLAKQHLPHRLSQQVACHFGFPCTQD